LIVMPRVRNSTNRIPCLSQNTAHMIFVVDLCVWRPTSMNRAYKTLCRLVTSASVDSDKVEM
jgi:hypothetical protein